MLALCGGERGTTEFYSYTTSKWVKRRTNKANFIKCLFITPWVLDVSSCLVVKYKSCISSTVLLLCSWPWETKLQKVTQPDKQLHHTQKPSSLHKDSYCSSDQFPLSFLGLILLQNKLWNVVASNNHFIISPSAVADQAQLGTQDFSPSWSWLDYMLMMASLLMRGLLAGMARTRISIFTLLSTWASSQHGALKKDISPGDKLLLEWLF